MIRGLTTAQKLMLVERSIWNNSTLVYRVLDWNPHPTWFAITLSRINLEPGLHEARVAAEIRTFFEDYEQLKAYITKHHDNLTLPFDIPATPSAYIAALCSTISLKGIRVPKSDKNRVYFNIRMRPLSVTRKGYRNWLSLLQSTTYFLDKSVTVPVCPSFICVICKDRDHPKEICPFLNLPGWPTRHQFAPNNLAHPGTNDDSSEEDSNPFLGNAGRGRGRGRGRSKGRGLFGSSARNRGTA
ncbi:hypothetical protein M422DRAFT_48143 [Sphaerobolus stellatus SS14]|uniref:Uncharacterized protein n=1 Tax=Sphaerobolus stellatus (strain SS14) TaxID=990650 RepID=A0A0C9V6Z5_SPHS4|nr:hypothetical protein M422DRAFT_48143 [Sphaerobolus stellatus SS14]